MSPGADTRVVLVWRSNLARDDAHTNSYVRTGT